MTTSAKTMRSLRFYESRSVLGATDALALPRVARRASYRTVVPSAAFHSTAAASSASPSQSALEAVPAASSHWTVAASSAPRSQSLASHWTAATSSTRPRQSAVSHWTTAASSAPRSQSTAVVAAGAASHWTVGAISTRHSQSAVSHWTAAASSAPRSQLATSAAMMHRPSCSVGGPGASAHTTNRTNRLLSLNPNF